MGELGSLPADPDASGHPARSITMPAGICAPTLYVPEEESSEEDELNEPGVLGAGNRAMTLPSISAAELMNIFPQDEAEMAPGFGAPYRAAHRGIQHRKAAQDKEKLLALAERLRSDNFEFIRQREAAAEAVPMALVPSFRPEDTVVIFDWDDTLFPTWFVTEVVNPCLADPQSDNLPADSPFIEPLRSHGQTVQKVLEAARSNARVAIVTLAQRPWVLNSAAKYLPDLDFEALLEHLQIPVIYARECLKRHMIQQGSNEDGLCLWTMAKQAAMKKALKKLYGKAPWMNVLSIGDSTVERNALTELLWIAHDEDLGRSPCCKTIKLMDDPSVEQLNAQLIMLSMWMQQLAAHGQDFDVSMDDSDECMQNIHRAFAAPCAA